MKRTWKSVASEEETPSALKHDLEELVMWLKTGDVSPDEIVVIDDKIKKIHASLSALTGSVEEKRGLIDLMNEVHVLVTMARFKIKPSGDVGAKKDKGEERKVFPTNDADIAEEPHLERTEEKSSAASENWLMDLAPRDIFFSQDSVGGRFSNGKNITDTFHELLHGKITPYDMSKMEVVLYEEKWVALTGNRRLYLFKKLEDLHVVKTVPVIRMDLMDTRVQSLFSRRLTTENQGVSVEMRTAGVEANIDRLIENWKLEARGVSYVSLPGDVKTSAIDSAPEKLDKGKLLETVAKGELDEERDVAASQAHERTLIGRFLRESALNSGKSCSGINETVKALEMGKVEIMIVWENFDVVRCAMKNPVTDEESVLFLTPVQEKDKTHFTDPTTGVELQMVDRQFLREWFANHCEDFCTTLKVINDNSEDASRFVAEFGGVGGLLKCPIDIQNKEPLVLDDLFDLEDF